MSESPDASKAAAADKKAKSPGSPNKLLLIMALTNSLGVFGLGGFLVYDKLHASHAAAQPAKPGAHGAQPAEHGAEAAHGEEAGHGGSGGHGEKASKGHGDGLDEQLPEGGGPIIPLESIVTNLSEPDSDRYLKVTVQLKITSEAAKPEVEAHLIPIRSQMLMYFSSLTLADVSGAEKRKAVQAALRRIANESMPTSRVRYVYFTDFVIQ